MLLAGAAALDITIAWGLLALRTQQPRHLSSHHCRPSSKRCCACKVDLHSGCMASPSRRVQQGLHHLDSLQLTSGVLQRSARCEAAALSQRIMSATLTCHPWCPILHAGKLGGA